MKKLKLLKQLTTITIILISFLSIGHEALAQVKIVTSTTDFAAIAKDIGGDKVEVVSLSKGFQDPHFVDAKPIFITRLNQADLLIYNGLELEIGWLPILITGARNSDILAGNSIGHYNASTSIKDKLDVHTGSIDRSMGDIHPGGNPHYMLDPRNGIPVARGIAARLIQIDPENASYYEENFKNFVSELKLKITEWKTELEPFQDTKVVTYHKLWVYFTKWAGFTEVGTIEPKPGIPPTPSHVANIIKTIENEHIKFIIAANYYPQKTPSIIAEKTGVPFLSLPVMVEGREGINTYIELFDALVGEITSTLNNTIDSQKGS
ncbi:MAG: metal ABC transporter substrate-binding protein [Thermodesulfobacteriota bacterium]